MIYDFIDEFLKRYYKTKESKERLPKFVNYYKNYLKFFCKPTFRNLKLNDIIQNYGEKCAEIYYKKNYGSSDKKEKDKLEKEKNKNKKLANDLKTIFTDTIKESINNISIDYDDNDASNSSVNTIQLNKSNFFNNKNNENLFEDIKYESSESNRLLFNMIYELNGIKNYKNKNISLESLSPQSINNAKNRIQLYAKPISKHNKNTFNKDNNISNTNNNLENITSYQSIGNIKYSNSSRNNINFHNTLSPRKLNNQTQSSFKITKSGVNNNAKLKLKNTVPFHVKNSLSIPIKNPQDFFNDNYNYNTTSNNNQFHYNYKLISKQSEEDNKINSNIHNYLVNNNNNELMRGSKKNISKISTFDNNYQTIYKCKNNNSKLINIPRITTASTNTTNRNKKNGTSRNTNEENSNNNNNELTSKNYISNNTPFGNANKLFSSYNNFDKQQQMLNKNKKLSYNYITSLTNRNISGNGIITHYGLKSNINHFRNKSNNIGGNNNISSRKIYSHNKSKENNNGGEGLYKIKKSKGYIVKLK